MHWLIQLLVSPYYVSAAGGNYFRFFNSWQYWHDKYHAGSVTKSTDEIGIWMTIDARGRNILLQFLIKAIAISVIVCLIGLPIGTGGAVYAINCTSAAVVISGQFMLLAFSVVTGVSIFFGFYPAKKSYTP